MLIKVKHIVIPKFWAKEDFILNNGNTIKVAIKEIANPTPVFVRLSIKDCFLLCIIILLLPQTVARKMQPFATMNKPTLKIYFLQKLTPFIVKSYLLLNCW